MKKLFNDKEMYNFNTKSKLGYIFKIIEPIIIYLGVLIVLEIILVMISIALGFKEGSTNYKILENIEEPIIDMILIFIMYKIYKKESDNDYPVVTKWMKKEYLIIGALIILFLAPLPDYFVTLLEKVFPHINDIYEETFTSAINNLNIIVNFVTICIFAPILEEIMCRGLILNRLLSKNKVWVSIFITALIFGVLHMNWSQGISAFLAGILLCYVYVKTRNIKVCILGHALNNIFALTFMYINISPKVETIINISFIVIGLILTYFFIRSDNTKVTLCKSKTVSN